MYKLSLFGSPVIKRAGHLVHIPRRKARALLAYLAATQKSYSRESLVALLWPDYDHRKGRADLSRILYSLRNILGADYFLSDRESVALSKKSDLWVDVVHFRRKLNACQKADMIDQEEDCRQQLTAAVNLYQADFLAGFTLPNCPTFDEWQLLQTEALRRDLSWALDKLVHIHKARNDLSEAIAYAQRWVGQDPLHEPAQRHLITLYAHNGQRAEAHRQYQTCERLLAEELGIEPQPETIQLYEHILIDGFRAPRIYSRYPLIKQNDHLFGQSGIDEVYGGPDTKLHSSKPQYPFVGRTRELSQMNNYLDEAMTANGRVIFVTGGAGRGKTSLLEEFARRAQEIHPDLIVAGGNGNTLAGAGDPFLPFRDVMGQLSGDVAARKTTGKMSVEQARRLQALLLYTTQVILEHGPHLLDVFVSGKQLLARATNAAPDNAGWLTSLQAEVTRRQVAPGALDQTALFGQFTNVVHQLAKKHPLLITLDDLQWIDEASIELLFHIGRRLSGSRILIVGAYRPNELLQGRSGEPHPLAQILNEFKRTYGDVFIDLPKADQVEGRAFVDALLDTEPNRLDSSFRYALFQKTGGHPLFTVELLRDMKSRGNLVKDEKGEWCKGHELEWKSFPARIEAVISRRIDRLDESLRSILEVASIEGELFTAEVVARVLGMEDRPLLHDLSRQLDNRHQLVREQGEIKTGKGYLSSYKFSHALFQQYLYRQLSQGERRSLHGAVAGALSDLYSDDQDQVVMQLAYHYTNAADWQKAVVFQSKAGDLSYQKATLPDATHHYQSALTHWPESDIVGKARTLRKLGECQWIMGQQQKALDTLQASYDLSTRIGENQGAGASQRLLGRVYWESGQADKAEHCYRQALSILEQEPQSDELAWALAGMCNYHMHQGNYDESIKFGERALALARQLGVDTVIIQCLCDLGSAHSSKGDWEGVAMEQESLERALALNRPHDAGRAYLYIGEALIYRGRYKQARDMLEEAQTYTRRMHVLYIAEAAASMLSEVNWLTGRWSAAIHQLQPNEDESHTTQPGSVPQLYHGIVLGRVWNDLGQPERVRNLMANMLTVLVNTLDPRVALMGEFARAEAVLDQPETVASAATEILEWTNKTTYLFPNVGMALLLICRLPVTFGWLDMVNSACLALKHLERLDRQYRTPVTAAYVMEGRGWLTIAEANAAEAANFFEQAAVQWQALDHPYDRARALNGMGQALILSGYKEGAQSAAQQAMSLVDTLAEQLEDPALKSSFLASVLVQEIQALLGGS
jgi:DNA-binding SARP family transcriptional activator